MPSATSARERSQSRLYDPTADKPRQLSWANPEQLECWKAGPVPLVLSGGYGSAKTYGAILKFLYMLDRYPGSRVAIGRSVFEELKKTTLATLRKILPYSAYAYGGRWSIAEKSIVLNNGSEFVLVHLDADDIESLIGGLEINGFLFDQAEEMKEVIFDKLQSRLGRWERVVVSDQVVEEEGYTRATWPWKNGDESVLLPPPYQILTVNPAGLDHWIYRRFHPDSPDHHEKRPIKLADGSGAMMSYKDLGYRMITMDSTTNKFLAKSTISSMLSKDESYVRRYVRGEWGFHEGSIHKVDNMSLIPGSKELLDWVRNNCLLFRGLDHGDSSPTAVVWGGRDNAGNIFIYREYAVGGKLVSFHRQEITAMSRDESYIFSVADPSIFGKRASGTKWVVIADEYSDCVSQPKETALYLESGDNNEMATRNRINEYLRKDPNHRHPFTGEYGAPHLYFICRTMDYPLGCYRLLVDVKSQSRKKVGTLNGAPVFSDERDKNIEDHLYDGLRYAIAASPPMAPTQTRRAEGRTWNDVARAQERTRRAAMSMESSPLLRRQARRG